MDAAGAVGAAALDVDFADPLDRPGVPELRSDGARQKLPWISDCIAGSSSDAPKIQPESRLFSGPRRRGALPPAGICEGPGKRPPVVGGATSAFS